MEAELLRRDICASRRRIGRIMKQEGLGSSYTVAQYRPKKDSCNESEIENVVNRQFAGQPRRNVVVSDLTYVRVGASWNYICTLIDQTLEAFHITRSLSHKGCPYDNAVAEAAFKIVKTEFVRKHVFDSISELRFRLADYVNWYNNHRIHSSLGYLTPVEYRKKTLKKVV